VIAAYAPVAGTRLKRWPATTGSRFRLALALFLSWLIQVTGPATVGRGVQIAVILWFCTVFATFATEYAFEGRGVKILAITSGYCLVGMVLMGLFPAKVMTVATIWGLPEIVIASIAGAWLYTESAIG